MDKNKRLLLCSHEGKMVRVYNNNADFPSAKSFALQNCNMKPKLIEGCNNCEAVDKSLRKCARCKLVRYCSKDCQAKDRPLHKKACNQYRKSSILLDSSEKSNFEKGMALSDCAMSMYRIAWGQGSRLAFEKHEEMLCNTKDQQFYQDICFVNIVLGNTSKAYGMLKSMLNQQEYVEKAEDDIDQYKQLPEEDLRPCTNKEIIILILLKLKILESLYYKMEQTETAELKYNRNVMHLSIVDLNIS